MARIPFLKPEDLSEYRDLVTQITGRRRGKLINVYRTLLHSPPLAESWFNHINNIRWGTELNGRLREIVIVRVGYLVSSAYVLRQHVPNLAIQEGMTEEECDALADWTKSDLFTEAERSVLKYVDAMTKNIVVSDSIFAPLKDFFSDRQIVELTLMIGAYISHSRVLQALEVDLEPDQNAGI